MIKIKLKIDGMEIKYQGAEKYLGTKVLPLVEKVKKSHNAEVKRDLLGLCEGLQKDLASLDGCFAEALKVNEESARRMKELLEKSASLFEQVGEGDAAAILQATENMQERQMSFNLQYLALQQQMQEENRQFSMVSNIMKTKHDTAKNSISNIR